MTYFYLENDACIHLPLQDLRISVNSLAAFLDAVHALGTKAGGHSSALTEKVHQLKRKFKVSPKIVLRKWASAVIPGRGRAKEEFLRDTLGVKDMDLFEQNWTRKDCVRILEAVCECAPEHACIPQDLRLRSCVV